MGQAPFASFVVKRLHHRVPRHLPDMAQRTKNHSLFALDEIVPVEVSDVACEEGGGVSES